MSNYLKKSFALLFGITAGFFASSSCFEYYDTLNIIKTCLIFSVVFLVVYSCILKISELKISAEKSDKIFLAMFFVLISFSFLNTDNHKTSEAENRNLYAYKPLFYTSYQNNKAELKINKSYMSDFENWFNDHFGLRTFYWYAANSKYLFIKDWETDSWIRTKDGWLFAKLKNKMDDYQNINTFNEQELKAIFEYLSSVDLYCKQNNKKFYFLIPPDKNKFYSEFIPKYYRKKSPDYYSDANLLYRYIRQNSDIKIFYPYELFEKNRNKELLFYKTDTHWSDFGASIMYDEVINQMKKDNNAITVLDYKKYETFKTLPKGDINSRLPEILKVKDDYRYLTYNLANDYKTVSFPTKKDEPYWKVPVMKTTNPKLSPTPKVVMYRDSFGTALVPFFSNTFGDVVYRWKYNIDKDEIKNADIVILEVVEKNLERLLNCQNI